MATRVELFHKTRYNYDRRVKLSAQTVRLRPAPHCRTKIVEYALRIEPEPYFINSLQDPFGNWSSRIVFPEKVKFFEVNVRLQADLEPINPFDFFLEPQVDEVPFKYSDQLKHDLAPYMRKDEALSELLSDYIQKLPVMEGKTIDYLVAVNSKLEQDIEYAVRMEPGIQTPEVTLSKALGSCRDSAWLLIKILRELGFAARFASGYLIQLKPDEVSLTGPAGPQKDFTDLHAWTEVFLPGAGWVGMDPTSGLFAGEGHIPLACTPNPTTAAPIEGAVDACEQEFIFDMHVDRVYEDLRVTKPYNEFQWNYINDLGERLDRRMQESGLNMTQGGEPTFVAEMNTDKPEWTTDALGPQKWDLSVQLMERLRAEWGTGGLLMREQGKWYPGEPLPRWALTSISRRDQVALWKNQDLLQPLNQKAKVVENRDKEFMEALCEELAIDIKMMISAYEDPLELLKSDMALPVDIEEIPEHLETLHDRQRMSELLRGKIKKVSAYVLPLAYDEDSYVTTKWEFKAKNCYLIPGDSPAGLRLPLKSLHFGKSGQGRPLTPQDPLEEKDNFQTQVGHAKVKVVIPEKDEDIFYTALCTEVRDGMLYVFLPPFEKAEAFLTLVEKLEKVAERFNQPIVVEGYAPSPDQRLSVFKITPDPGVIEVNVLPTKTWRELKDQTEFLYRQAREIGLVAGKFTVDGRSTGTGGGCHITMGADKPADSPFLKRPHLLASLLAYWNNHPSLSYLFSGSFIGPTSQAPRVDEGRRDAIVQLEIALEQLRKEGSHPLWMVDRALRHLLTDLTGNTHRSEFCIDKLYSPDSSSGRLGLVEFRNFEMLPSAKMNLTQALLLRSLVERFWDNPYKEPLVHWGQDLHDRFLLPSWLWEDFKRVLEFQTQYGYVLDESLFLPHFEFRMPLAGSVSADGVKMEIRHGLEPWYVLGEESTGGGTARYVDSSVERLEVRLSPADASRHAVICNGRRLPLRPVTSDSDLAAGLRFKAWNPVSALHASVEAQTELHFNLVDLRLGRTIAGCTYFVAHPGGRSHENPPLNYEEAQGRKQARFSSFSGKCDPLKSLPAPEVFSQHICTLDLRRLASNHLKPLSFHSDR
jgi:uncharacterized protein (DUF2126 family)